MRARTLIAVPALALALSITGCKTCCNSCEKCEMHHDMDHMEGDAQDVSYVNKTCPIGGGEIDTYTKGVAYKGHNVGFCCAGCEGGWNEMSDTEKDQFIADAMTGSR